MSHAVTRYWQSVLQLGYCAGEKSVWTPLLTLGCLFTFAGVYGFKLARQQKQVCYTAQGCSHAFSSPFQMLFCNDAQAIQHAWHPIPHRKWLLYLPCLNMR